MSSTRISRNSYAYAGALGYFIEASRRGMWNGPKELVQQVVNEYINTVAEYGVVCCHHTCANIEFNKLIAAMASVSPDTLNALKKVLEREKYITHPGPTSQL